MCTGEDPDTAPDDGADNEPVADVGGGVVVGEVADVVVRPGVAGGVANCGGQEEEQHGGAGEGSQHQPGVGDRGQLRPGGGAGERCSLHGY